MLELRPHIEELAESNEIFDIGSGDWEEIQVLDSVLLEPYLVTMVLQEDGCTFGD